ncbi:putative transcription factor C3H family [Helianthus annuus]|nr:putative transcription factor C3H family [Helianthus annuus]
MFQHPFNGGNNGEGELFSQQSGSNFQFEATNNRSRNNSEVNMNPTKSTSLRPAGQKYTFSNIPVNRGTTHIFYKTRMCQKFLDGTCRNGNGCTFAHGPNDLCEPPPNWQELVKDNRGGNAEKQEILRDLSEDEDNQNETLQQTWKVMLWLA